MVKVLRVVVKDVDKLIEDFKKKGFNVEEAPSTVLADESEVTTLKILKDNTTHGYAVVHFITPYYRVELSQPKSDEDYLKALLRVKYSGEKWRIPVNDVAVISFTNELETTLANYRDEYPTVDGENLVSEYRKRNPEYHAVLKLLVARFLDEYV
uniref:Uncharacterized protein n=1 Tax=Thermogladius calderae TaxID=1200300 RepID=A0A7J3XZF1_9CREN